MKPVILPLSALLSQVLVAFTIKFDNEFEHRMPHRTTNHGATAGSRQGPWLVSMAMWWNCMRFLGDEGATVRELETLARTKTNLNGMQRWGTSSSGPTRPDSRPKPPQSEWVIHATAKGRKAQEVWRPLCGVVEARWRERFGEAEIEKLRKSLLAVIGRMDSGLPDCMPILGYGLFSGGPRPAARDVDTGSDSALPALLSRVLLAFAIEFERESDLSLAICANVARVLDEKGVRVRDLPATAGVSKEAIAMALGFLQKKLLVAVEPEQTGKAKIARLTAKGRAAQAGSHRLLGIIEERWQVRFGEDAIRALRAALERLVGDTAAERSPLFRRLEPYPDGWRASARKPDTLPHYPMVLHRGGFPDGS